MLLDVDGTLAPIVSRPQDAAVPEETRRELRRLSGRYRLLAFVSGRAGDDAESRSRGLPSAFHSGGIAPDDHDPRALGDKEPGRRQADSAGRAGDDAHSVAEA